MILEGLDMGWTASRVREWAHQPANFYKDSGEPLGEQHRVRFQAGDTNFSLIYSVDEMPPPKARQFGFDVPSACLVARMRHLSVQFYVPPPTTGADVHKGIPAMIEQFAPLVRIWFPLQEFVATTFAVFQPNGDEGHVVAVHFYTDHDWSSLRLV